MGIYSWLSLSRLRLSRKTAYLEQKIWSLFKQGNLTSGDKILWIRGEIAPEEQFLPFPTIFSTYISNLRSQITCSFVKFSCSFGIFLNSVDLICRSTDISKCFRGSLRLRDNENRLYFQKVIIYLYMPFCASHFDMRFNTVSLRRAKWRQRKRSFCLTLKRKSFRGFENAELLDHCSFTRKLKISIPP